MEPLPLRCQPFKVVGREYATRALHPVVTHITA